MKSEHLHAVKVIKTSALDMKNIKWLVWNVWSSKRLLFGLMTGDDDVYLLRNLDTKTQQSVKM